MSKVTVRFPNDVAGLDHDELVAWVQNHCATGLDDDKLQGAFNKEGADFIRHLYTTVMNAPIAEDQQSVLIRNTRQCLALPIITRRLRLSVCWILLIGRNSWVIYWIRGCTWHGLSIHWA